MSLSLTLELPACDHCHRPYEDTPYFNYTYNVSGMWYLAFPNHDKMIPIDDMRGAESIPMLTVAIERLRDQPKRFMVINPANGWGSYETFVAFIEKLLQAATEYPEGTWRASR